MAKRVVSAVSCILFIIIATATITVTPVLADDETHAGDIVLTGSQTMEITGNVYTQTGNIYVQDQAQLSITNATLIFNQSYHEEFAIYVQNEAVLDINNSTITTGISLNENYEIKVWDTANVSITDSDLKISAGYLLFMENYSGESSILRTGVHNLSMAFSPYGGSTISISDSQINTWGFRFSDFQGEFSNLGPGLKESWHFQNGSYDITLENTTIEGDMGLHCDMPSDITVRDSHFFQLGCQGLSTISLRVIDSEIAQFCLHGFNNDCSGHLSELKKGYHKSWKLRDHADGSCIPDVILENTTISDGWLVTSFGATIALEHSELERLGSYSCGNPTADNETSVSHSTVNELILYSSKATLTFDDVSITHFNAYLPSEVVIEGSINFPGDSVITNWTESTTVRRIYPVHLLETNGDGRSGLALQLRKEDGGALLWSGVTDSDGTASFEIDFDGSNHDDSWRLAIDGTARDITLLSSTPIGTTPRLSVFPAQHSFGLVGCAGAPVVRTVTIYNAGYADLAVGTLSITGGNAGDFGIQSDLCSEQTIAPGESKTVEVRFQPSLIGARAASLQVPSNDPQNPQVTVELSGIGDLKGDFNNDGEVTLADIIISLQIVTGTTPQQPVSLAGDVNGDGKIGLEDTVYTMRGVAGVE